MRINMNKQKHKKSKMATNICIPRMESTISKSYIFKVFCNLKVGYIENITEIPFHANPQFKRVIVRLKWNDSDHSKYIQSRFQSGTNVKIVHAMPWYWICVPNRLQRPYHLLETNFK
jgi:hypothetical protein